MAHVDGYTTDSRILVDYLVMGYDFPW